MQEHKFNKYKYNRKKKSNIFSFKLLFYRGVQCHGCTNNLVPGRSPHVIGHVTNNNIALPNIKCTWHVSHIQRNKHYITFLIFSCIQFKIFRGIIVQTKLNTVPSAFFIRFLVLKFLLLSPPCRLKCKTTRKLCGKKPKMAPNMV